MADDLKTDIRLIQNDIEQIQKFFTKVEMSIDQMTELSKIAAVQNEVLEYTKAKLEDVEKLCEDTRRTDELRLNMMNDRLEEYRRSSRADHEKLATHNAEKRAANNKEIIDKIQVMSTGINGRLNEQSKRITALENWRYYMMGMGVVVLLLLAKINWPGLFG